MKLFYLHNSDTTKETPEQPQKEICPGHIIQGNPFLKAVVNKSNYNTGIFFEHKDIVNHCMNHCRETSKCKEEQEKGKKIILELFKSYGKDIIQPDIELLSQNNTY